MASEYPISEQVQTLAAKEALKSQTDKVEYGQVIFVIRAGKVYRVDVTSSLIFNETEIEKKQRVALGNKA